MSNNELIEISDGGHGGQMVAPPSGPLAGVNVEMLLAKAIDSKAVVEVLERLEAMRQRLKAEAAKEAFCRALSEFQSECPAIIKRRKGPQDAYRYAPLDDIVEQVKPLLQKHGFSYTINESDPVEGWVTAVIELRHNLGHSETKQFRAPIDTRNKLMTAQQQYGGAMTFAKRYAFTNALGILTADEDLDGNEGRGQRGPSARGPQNPRLRRYAVELWKLLGPVVAGQKDWAKANEWLLDKQLISDTEEAPNLTEARFEDIILALRDGRIKP